MKRFVTRLGTQTNHESISNVSKNYRKELERLWERLKDTSNTEEYEKIMKRISVISSVMLDY
jgi:hypothetical protein